MVFCVTCHSRTDRYSRWRLGSAGSAPVGQLEPFTSINLPTPSTAPRNRERTRPAMLLALYGSVWPCFRHSRTHRSASKIWSGGKFCRRTEIEKKLLSRLYCCVSHLGTKLKLHEFSRLKYMSLKTSQYFLGDYELSKLNSLVLLSCT